MQCKVTMGTVSDKFNQRNKLRWNIWRVLKASNWQRGDQWVWTPSLFTVHKVRTGLLRICIKALSESNYNQMSNRPTVGVRVVVCPWFCTVTSGIKPNNALIERGYKCCCWYYLWFVFGQRSFKLLMIPPHETMSRP